MILMEKYVSLTNAAMKWIKNIFTVITAKIAEKKKILHWVIPC